MHAGQSQQGPPQHQPLKERCRCGWAVACAGLLHLVSLPELRVLDLSNCSQLSDAGLACAAQLPRLETLNLQGCTGISDVGLMRLWGMPRLRHVICHNTITDVGLHILTGITGAERERGVWGERKARGGGRVMVGEVLLFQHVLHDLPHIVAAEGVWSSLFLALAISAWRWAAHVQVFSAAAPAAAAAQLLLVFELSHMQRAAAAC